MTRGRLALEAATSEVQVAQLVTAAEWCAPQSTTVTCLCFSAFTGRNSPCFITLAPRPSSPLPAVPSRPQRAVGLEHQHVLQAELDRRHVRHDRVLAVFRRVIAVSLAPTRSPARERERAAPLVHPQRAHARTAPRQRAPS